MLVQGAGGKDVVGVLVPAGEAEYAGQHGFVLRPVGPREHLVGVLLAAGGGLAVAESLQGLGLPVHRFDLVGGEQPVADPADLHRLAITVQGAGKVALTELGVAEQQQWPHEIRMVAVAGPFDGSQVRREECLRLLVLGILDVHSHRIQWRPRIAKGFAERLLDGLRRERSWGGAQVFRSCFRRWLPAIAPAAAGEQQSHHGQDDHEGRLAPPCSGFRLESCRIQVHVPLDTHLLSTFECGTGVRASQGVARF